MTEKTKTDFLTDYYNLRDNIDRRAQELSEQHSSYLNCKKGCDSCCESISVFPIEFFSIHKELEGKHSSLPNRRFNKFRKSCTFLKDGACSIYESRPIICRTQGLPLMYQSLKSDNYEVSYCQLNFKDFTIDKFTIDNSLFMPQFNSELFLLNKKFVETKKILNSNFKRRIPLYKLLSAQRF